MATKIQENVKRAIEGMTGLQVVEVNVNIRASTSQEEKPEEVRVGNPHNKRGYWCAWRPRILVVLSRFS